MEDEDGLVKPKAFVVLHESYTGSSQTAEQLKMFVKERLAPFKYPRSFEFMKELPKNDRGKIERKKLRDESNRQGAK